MKKPLLAHIGLLCALLLLCGCGVPGGDTGTAASGPSQGATAQPASETMTAPADATEAPGTQATESAGGSNILVAWFSATGNTGRIAGLLAEHLRADTCEIVPETPYTEADLDYGDSGSRTSVEQNDANARPAISGDIPDMAQYDTIFLGYPIWHGQAPRIVSTFLESCALAGKTVVPFCTSGGSGIGSSDTNLHPLAADANWQAGRRFAANAASSEIEAWADGFAESGLLHIQIGDNTLTAALADNSSAAALKQLLADGPLTVEMSDYGGFEKVGELGRALPRNDAPCTAEAGDLILYLGTRFVIYYGANTWDLTRLGKIGGVSPQELKAILGDGDITAILSLAAG